MMKKIFWMLLLGNLVFLAVMLVGVGDDPLTQPLPALHEEKIKLVRAPLEKTQTPLPWASAVMPVAPPVSAPAETAANIPVCMEWGEFSGQELTRATLALSELQLGDRLYQRRIEQNIGYWVYIPASKDRATANRKVAQLKERGIDEYFIVTEPGPWLNAISLGVFRTREAAQNFLDDLQDSMEIRNAQIGERASKLTVIRFVIKGVDDELKAWMTEINKDFPGREFKVTPCTLTR